ncbi:hypothetical protein [Pseudomonas ficuserectae]|uniref:hypothetical protein n=1 Tax=Pseudomonas ficuserectae TaxID=53410 RepID=UPI00211BC681|nr:hypothetical protein [Pseudomonas ficuserectae]
MMSAPPAPVSALIEFENVTIEQTIADLVNKIQEIEDVLSPGNKIKSKLTLLCREIDELTTTRDDLASINALIVTDQGSWEEQTHNAHKQACYYAAMTLIEQANGNIVKTMSALSKAAYYAGRAAGYSHHRKTTAVEKARKAGLAKASVAPRINQKIIELLSTNKPRHGWTGVHHASQLLAPLLQTFLHTELDIKKADLKSVQSIITTSIHDDVNVLKSYHKNANKRQL